MITRLLFTGFRACIWTVIQNPRVHTQTCASRCTHAHKQSSTHARTQRSTQAHTHARTHVRMHAQEYPYDIKLERWQSRLQICHLLCYVAFNSSKCCAHQPLVPLVHGKHVLSQSVRVGLTASSLRFASLWFAGVCWGLLCFHLGLMCFAVLHIASHCAVLDGASFFS